MIRGLALLTIVATSFYAAGASAAQMQIVPESSREAESGGDTSAVPTSESATGATQATDTAASVSTASGWQFSITPYGWLASTHAHILTPQGESIRVSQSFRDALKDLKFAAMATVEARHGKLLILSDLIYLKLGSSATARLGPIPLDSNVDLKLLSSTNMIGYRAIDKGAMFLDVLAGVRISGEHLDIDLIAPNRAFGRDFQKTSVGPVIASRFRTPLGGRWGAALYGDLGGFGISSDFSWQLLGTIQYDISSHWRLAGGWRHLSVHDKRRGFDVHLGFDGPVIGATYRISNQHLDARF